MEADAAQTGRADLTTWRNRKPRNFYATDPLFQSILRHVLGSHFKKADRRLAEAGALSATRMDELARESSLDENLPRLRDTDEFGTPCREVLFHPSYHELGSLLWNAEILSILGTDGNETLCGALAYLFSQNGEAGHLCPVACTAGAIKLIRTLGTDDQKTRYLPRLLDRNYATRLHASQFLTEVQGGSDVGANSCVAVPEENGGWYRITGEKWFCSVQDAGLFVVTARPAGAPAGTGGLGLFLVPRKIEGQLNHFTIRRLKPKLGTRSMATGETEFHGALGEPIGPLQDGFKNAVRLVLDTSRLHNAVSACGILRRAFVEARTYAQHRRAFGRPIEEYPPVRRTLSQIRTEGAAALASTFRILQMTDRIATGAAEPHEPAARRIHVMINKYWTSLQCTGVVRRAIEVLGGNGTIEDFSVLPRLYRDSIVLESWEGTHNTLCLQVLRDFTKRGMHMAWLHDLRTLIHTLDPPMREHIASMIPIVAAGIDHAMNAPAEEAQWLIRHVVDEMCILHSCAALLKLADGTGGTDLARYFLHCHRPDSRLPDEECRDLEARIPFA